MKQEFKREQNYFLKYFLKSFQRDSAGGSPMFSDVSGTFIILLNGSGILTADVFLMKHENI